MQGSRYVQSQRGTDDGRGLTEVEGGAGSEMLSEALDTWPLRRELPDELLGRHPFNAPMTSVRERVRPEAELGRSLLQSSRYAVNGAHEIRWEGPPTKANRLKSHPHVGPPVQQPESKIRAADRAVAGVGAATHSNRVANPLRAYLQREVQQRVVQHGNVIDKAPRAEARSSGLAAQPPYLSDDESRSCELAATDAVEKPDTPSQEITVLPRAFAPTARGLVDRCGAISSPKLLKPDKRAGGVNTEGTRSPRG